MELIDTTGLKLDYGYVSLKEIRRQEMKDTWIFRICKTISVVMDKYCLDPILGFFLPGFDLVGTFCSGPFIYLGLFELKSLSLTLAIIYNTMKDALVGSIPILGDILDFFVRSYKKNYELIIGYVDNDENIKREVRAGAVKAAIMIIIIGIMIYYITSFVMSIYTRISDFFSSEDNTAKVEQVVDDKSSEETALELSEFLIAEEDSSVREEIELEESKTMFCDQLALQMQGNVSMMVEYDLDEEDSKTQYSFNQQGELVSVIIYNDEEAEITINHDDDNRLLLFSNYYVTQSFEYDSKGLCVSVNYSYTHNDCRYSYSSFNELNLPTEASFESHYMRMGDKSITEGTVTYYYLDFDDYGNWTKRMTTGTSVRKGTRFINDEETEEFEEINEINYTTNRLITYFSDKEE